jgi:chorismate mutase
MEFKPVIPENPHHLIVAGPCSAETEEQVLETARGLAGGQVHLFRAGIWKPRTRPNSFEGVGDVGLKWLQTVQQETGLKVTTEVANATHVELALKHGIDVLWVGARTTVSPFAVSEIAAALKGVDIPVMVKNPVNPDIKLWIGAVERFLKADLQKLTAIHRGFSFFGESPFRNVPRWQIPIELMRTFPQLPVICDCSHICGRRDTLAGVAQTALDLNFKGLMMEVHPNPDTALSDAAQQVTPTRFLEILSELQFRNPTTSDSAFLETLENLRHQIDDIDAEVVRLLGERMNIAERIGGYKESNNIAILQPERWAKVLETALQNGKTSGLGSSFIQELFKAIHQESISRQSKVLNTNEIAAE